MSDDFLILLSMLDTPSYFLLPTEGGLRHENQAAAAKKNKPRAIADLSRTRRRENADLTSRSGRGEEEDDEDVAILAQANQQ